MRRSIKLCLFTFLSGLILCSCGRLLKYKKYINTEAELVAHYDTLSFKPDYKTIKTKDSQLFVATFGKDSLRPLVFIHGAPGRWDGFMKQLDDTSFHKDFHLIAPDRPGYGKSFIKKKYKAQSIINQAELIHQALQINKSGEKAILVTRSYGCPVGAYMAYKFPSSYERLIMLAPAIDPDAEKYFKFSKLGKIPLFRWFLPKRLNTATDEKFRHAKDLKEILPIWTAIKVPVLTVFGGQDWVLKPENYSFAKAKLGQDKTREFIYLPQSGHRISQYNPDLVKSEIYESIKHQ
jgi:pimeloyl-ACP methyl ester carboxylesterase